jgi:hypothetical protein
MRAKGTHALKSTDGGTSQKAKKKRREGGIHSLKRIEGGTSQDNETTRARGTHFLKSTIGGTSQKAKEASDQRLLTILRAQRKEQVRIA